VSPSFLSVKNFLQSHLEESSYLSLRISYIRAILYIMSLCQILQSQVALDDLDNIACLCVTYFHKIWKQEECNFVKNRNGT